MNKVFVYGTLKRGQPNHSLMSPNSVKYLGQARTVDKYPLVVATKFKYPFLLNAPGLGKRITGDVYGMTDEFMKITDSQERHPNFYRRTKIRVKFFMDKDDRAFQEQPEEEVWAYLLVNFKDELLSHDWLETFDAADHVVESDVIRPVIGCSEEDVDTFFNNVRETLQN